MTALAYVLAAYAAFVAFLAAILAFEAIVAFVRNRQARRDALEFTREWAEYMAEHPARFR